MKRLALLAPLLGVACSYPQFVATRVVDLTVPAEGLTRLLCETHNGAITVTGADTTQIELRAEMSVRGHTQAEADANLQKLEIARETGEGTLHVFGRYPDRGLFKVSPQITFTMKVPAHLAVGIESHNGSLTLRGVRGTAKAETHNGSIDVEIDGADVTALTHNGDVRVGLRSAGPVRGDLTSHNGDIDVQLAAGASTTLDASTHNGRVTPPAGLADASVSRRSVRGRLGDGGGTLRATTHNGDVSFR